MEEDVIGGESFSYEDFTQGSSDLGDTIESGFDRVISLWGRYNEMELNNRLEQENAERARRGQAPITRGQITPNPQAMNLSPLLIVGAVGVVAYLLLRK